MDERVLRLRVGVVVLAAAIITGILVMRFGDMPLPGTQKYTIYVIFPEAPGVQVGTPVRKSGVSIGRVTAVDLLKEGGVRVTADIDGNQPIFQSEVCRISSASLLGDSVLEFVSGPRSIPDAPRLEDGSEIQNGMVAGNPMDVLVNMETDMKQALGSIKAAGDEVRVAARNLNTALANNDDQLPRVMQKAERALDQFSQTMVSMNSLFGDPQMREGMKRTVTDIPQLVDEARATLKRADEAFGGLSRVTDRAERNLLNLEGFTKPLGERGETLVENLDGSLANVNQLLEQLVEFSGNLNSRRGTLGRLMNDEELYDRLNNTLANAEEITFKLKPILDDVRVFSDKIARDPRQLGVKGALDRRPIGVGTKQTSYAADEPIYVEQEVWEPSGLPRH